MSETATRRDSSIVMRSQIPNGLSVLRFALAAIWVELAASHHTGRAAYVIIAIIAAGSDFIDGRIARRLGVASNRGRWLDGIADVTFILAALWCEARAGALPIYIPILIALSFSQYALDSILIASAPAGPIRSRLGHWGGIVNYAIVIALAFSAPLGMIATVVRALSPLVALFYIAAIAERAWLFYRR